MPPERDATEPPPLDEGAVNQAAARAADPDGLLHGERSDSPYLDDAVHWISVYGELAAYKESLLRVSEERIASMQGPEAVEESRNTDDVLLRQQLGRYQRRLHFWTERRQELLQRRDHTA
ncbi:MAG: hypothetical protein ABR564_08540 [Candidatus Dormibacteria bacterium]